MAALPDASWRAAVMGRWAARILGTLLVLLFLTFVVGEGLPKPSALSAGEKVQFLGLAGLTTGLLLAWKWEGFGGLLGVAGFALLAALNRGHLGWAFWAPAAIALLHIACWGRLRAAAPAGLAAWSWPRPVILSLLGLLACFLLLSANEIFGRPPLMAGSLSPGSALAGNWHAAAATRGLPASLTIHPDATVTGNIGGAEVIEAHIAHGRSWFGRLMHINSQYLIEGRLARQAAAPNQFTIPLNPRGETLSGAIFLAGRPTALTLTR